MNPRIVRMGRQVDRLTDPLPGWPPGALRRRRGARAGQA